MFIRPLDRQLIASWSSHYGWSTTVAKRNFTVYRAIEWMAAVCGPQLEETEGWFWCQQERLAQRTGMSRPTIRAAIEALVEMDVLQHERRWLPRSESLCSWFRLKIPPSCAGRVRTDGALDQAFGRMKPLPGTEKSSTRVVKKFSTPSYVSKREKLKRERAQALAEIQDRCLQRGLDPTEWALPLVETAETVLKAQERAARKERRLRSAGVCDPLDVKLKAKQEA